VSFFRSALHGQMLGVTAAAPLSKSDGDYAQKPLPSASLTAATPSETMVCKIKSWLSAMIQ